LLTKRIIACLDVRAGRVVKGIQFVDIIDAGDPAELAHRHAALGADEIVLLDITATHEGRGTLLDTVKRTAAELFIPFTVGGGIRSAEDAEAVFTAGADKVSINSAAIARPDLIGEIGSSFGAQAVIVAIDARRAKAPSSRPEREARSGETCFSEEVLNAEVYVSGGRKPTGLRVVDWAREAEQRGAGEILLTSMDSDGTRSGFDNELTAAVSSAVQIPVIASGGAGNAQHFADVFKAGRADAALAASIFHFGVTSSRALKEELAAQGIPMRLPC
jgi:cyclase